METTTLKKIIHSLLGVVFPKLCLSCKELIEEELLLCKTCKAMLQMINPKERCSTCFSSEENHLCSNFSYFVALASVFDYEEVASCLVKKLKYAKAFTLAESLGNFMALQFLALNWPLPDLIVPIPLSFSKKIERGYNQSFLLGKSLGKTLNVPCKELLKKDYDLSQAALKSNIRRESRDQKIRLKKRYESIEDKVILLVDDVITTGTTLEQAAKALFEGSPRALYALTLCKTNLNE